MTDWSCLPYSVQALVLDFDGVLTDNTVYVLADGSEAVRCHRADGGALSWLREQGLPVLVITAEQQDAAIRARCHKLGIQVMSGVENKLTALKLWLKENEIDAGSVIYIGNDAADAEAMSHVGCGIAVADAYPEAQGAANLITTRPGGNGAVREVVDQIQKSKLKLQVSNGSHVS